MTVFDPPAGPGLEARVPPSELYHILDRINLGLFRATRPGRILDCNDAFLRLLQEDRSRLDDLNIFERFARVQDRETVLSLEPGQFLNDLMVDLRRRDGSLITVSLTVGATTGPDGQVVIEASPEDVTSRQMAAQRLRRSEEDLREAVSLLEATLDSTTDGILVVNTEGAIVRYNRKFRELWHLTDDMLEARDDAAAIQLVLDQLVDPQAFLAKVRALYADPLAESLDTLPFKDGRIFERHSLPQLIAGRPVGRVWSFRDVTERHSLEEQLRQAARMDAVGQLAGGIAHDFNNILTTIIGTCEIIAGHLPEHSPVAEDVTEVRRAAARAVDLTRQLLAFSRLQVLRPRTLDLNRLVEASQPVLGRLLGGAGHTLTLDLQADPGWIEADPAQLEQVLVNLATNARDAMEAGGGLTVGTLIGPQPEGWSGAPEGCVILTVRDTGPGMAPEVRNRAFEPFFTTKPVGRGFGLGLSTVYGIVRQSNGFIAVDSEPGAGTTFRIYFPARRAPATGDTPPSAIPAARTGGTVLIAEDEAAVRRMTGRALRAVGYRVLEAEDGLEALRVIEQQGSSLALLVTDVVMPGMSGPELVGRVRTRFPDLRVVFMSGYAPEALANSLAASPWFLAKPFTPAELVSLVADVLTGPPPTT